MFENIENLKLLSSYQGTTKDYLKVECRKSHAFVFRTAGAGIYETGEKSINIHEGEMAFLPKGSAYEFKKISKNKCEYVSIGFDADISDEKITVFDMENFTDKSYILSHYVNLWKFGSQNEKYKCYSLFYNILSYITNIENTDYSSKKKSEIIEPAIEYMRAHIFDPNLRTENLHILCGISDTYFRKIFISKFGTSPKEYIIASRLSHAKDIIDSENMSSVTDLALATGYSDPLYFSRAFKKKYGVSPTQT